MRVVIDAARCLGNARCVVAAPEVFDVDDDGFALLIDEDPQAALVGKVQLAVRSCPTGAISITE